MVFHGLQKMTLLDFPGRVACTVFTGGCNFRCPFCHNALLVTSLDMAETYEQSDIISFLKKRVGLLDGVCITGGEPLLNEDIIDFVKEVKELGFLVKVDTNGSRPETLKKLVNASLVDYVAMDIKNSKELYGTTAGVENFDLAPIEESVDFLLSGKVDYEFRTTVVKPFHTAESIESAAKWIKGAKRYFLQGFTDSGYLIGDGVSEADKSEMELMLEKAKAYVPAAQLRGV